MKKNNVKKLKPKKSVTGFGIKNSSEANSPVRRKKQEVEKAR